MHLEKVKSQKSKVKCAWKMFNVLLMVVFAAPILGFAVSEYESDEKITAGVIGTAGTGATYELSPSKLFQSEEDYGQDLYEFVYKRVKHEASDKAVARVLADRKISQEELFLVVPGSNIGELLRRDDTKTKFDPQTIEKRRTEIQRDLAEEKELADLLVDISLEVEQTEIFSNGDESDSGFDLIVDLDIIETILFGKTETVLGGAGPGAPPGAAVVGVGGGGGGGAAPPAAGAGGPGPGAAAAAPGAAAGGGAGGASPAAGPAGAASPEQAGVICPLNDSFNSEVERARAAEKAGAGAVGSGGAGAEGPGGGEGGGAGGAGEDGGAGEAGADAGGGEEKPPLTPEPAGDWSRPRLCGKVFCLKIEAVYKTESAYLANANCIACHFEKMNDAFKKTLDHNLVPSKATGNLLEGPKCKRSFLNLKWNFILVPQPILTPPNDDLVVKGDFLGNFVDFLEKYYRLPGGCDELKKKLKGGENLQSALGLCKPPTDPAQETARNALNQATEGTDQAKVIRQIREQVAAKKQEVVDLMKKTRLDTDAQNQATHFQVIMQEIDTFNAYFKGFLTLYNKLISGEADSPCQTLANKPTCS